MRKLTALLVLGFVAGCNEPKVSVELKGQPAIPALPRYQIVINTHETRLGTNTPAFLLDTQEGRVWRYEPSTVIPHFMYIEIIDQQGKLGPTIHEWSKSMEHLESESRKSQDSK